MRFLFGVLIVLTFNLSAQNGQEFLKRYGLITDSAEVSLKRRQFLYTNEILKWWPGAVQGVNGVRQEFDNVKFGWHGWADRCDGRPMWSDRWVDRRRSEAHRSFAFGPDGLAAAMLKQADHRHDEVHRLWVIWSAGLAAAMLKQAGHRHCGV